MRELQDLRLCALGFFDMMIVPFARMAGEPGRDGLERCKPVRCSRVEESFGRRKQNREILIGEVPAEGVRDIAAGNREAGT